MTAGLESVEAPIVRAVAGAGVAVGGDDVGAMISEQTNGADRLVKIDRQICVRVESELAARFGESGAKAASELSIRRMVDDAHVRAIEPTFRVLRAAPLCSPSGGRPLRRVRVHAGIVRSVVIAGVDRSTMTSLPEICIATEGNGKRAGPVSTLPSAANSLP